MVIRNIVGNVPEPDELYGRNDFIGHLWRQIQGNNILLLAPRRFGKTGVMRHVLMKPREGYLPIYFDLEDVDSPQEFVWRLTREVLSNDRLRQFVQKAKGIPQKVCSWVQDTFDEIAFAGAKVKFKESLTEDWRDTARRLLLQLEAFDQRIIFILDELPAMLEVIAERQGEDVAHNFMAWFRVVRLQQKDVLRRHRFVVGGSIGIDMILRRLKTTDKLNDFERLYVQPLQADTAMQLARDLAEAMDIQCDKQVIERLLAIIGQPVPYFIHLFFSQLGQLARNDRSPLTPETLELIYKQKILGPTCKHYFNHYRERLRRYGTVGERAAVAILSTVAQQRRASASVLWDVYRKIKKRGASELGFAELMADLECDWYLVLDPHTNE
ncbi:MAG: hypothetical protein JSW47_11925 [Phycisphaerales bacterium]|nr:MAG: hypothetical protein JSW47_11925 [Phycisphaerales bacterium]